MTDETKYVAIEQRIERLILALGGAMSGGALLGWGVHAFESCATGTVLSWINFRWLRQGAAALMRLAMTQAGAEHVRVPRNVHAKFLGRLALLLVVVYVILVRLRLPVFAFLCGALAILPAIFIELLYELARGQRGMKAP